MRITLGDGAPEACMAILGPERRTRDGETEGTDLLAVPRRRGEVRASRPRRRCRTARRETQPAGKGGNPAIGGRALREDWQGAPDRRRCDGRGQADLNLRTKELAKADTSFNEAAGFFRYENGRHEHRASERHTQ